MLWVTPLLCCKPYLEKPPSNVFCCWSRRKKSRYSSRRQNYQKSGTLWTGITCKIVVYSHDVHFITRSHPATADTYLICYIGNEWMKVFFYFPPTYGWILGLTASSGTVDEDLAAPCSSALRLPWWVVALTALKITLSSWLILPHGAALLVLLSSSSIISASVPETVWDLRKSTI